MTPDLRVFPLSLLDEESLLEYKVNISLNLG
jgi:hypothetical protein